MRMLDGRERAAGQLLGRLVAPGVDARDDDVEASQQLIGVVEGRVGSDLELGAVQDAERGELGVDPRDLHRLLVDARRSEAASDPERGRVIREHDVLVAEVTRGPGHHLDRVDAVRPAGVRVRVASHVVVADERRQATSDRGVDLAIGLPQLRSDERQPEALVDVRLLAGIEQRAVLDDLEALLGQRPAAIEGHAPQRDVVVATAGEVHEVRPPRARRADHEVDARTLAQDDARLVRPGREDLLDFGQGVEARDDRPRIVDGRQDVEIADRRAPPAQGPRRRDPPHASDIAQRFDQAANERVRVVQQEARVRASPLDPPDPLQDVLLRPRREALDVSQAAGLGGGPQPFERVDPELGVQQSHRLRPDARDAQHVEQTVGDLGAEPLVILEVAGLAELGELRGQRRSGPRDLRWLTSTVECGDVIGVALDDVGHAAIGHRLVDDLSEDLEHVTDLVEDPRQLPVGDDGLAAARDAAGSGHRGPF